MRVTIMSFKIDESRALQLNKLVLKLRQNGVAISRSEIIRAAVEHVISNPHIIPQIMMNTASSTEIVYAKRDAVRAVYLSLRLVEEILKHPEFYDLAPHTRERLCFISMMLQKAFNTLISEV